MSISLGIRRVAFTRAQIRASNLLRPSRGSLHLPVRGRRPRGREDRPSRLQKYGTLVLLKGKGLLEPKLAALGYKVAWAEFPAGPQLLEALGAGAIDFGSTGEAPPIFAQASASGDRLLYVAHEPPAPLGEAILVPKDSPIRSVADLKGSKVALNKGSNVHYLLVRALEAAGLSYADIQPIFLAPADARAAFERGSVDAWAIWDPFQAAAEAATQARTLVERHGACAEPSILSRRQPIHDANPRAVDAILSAIAEIDAFAKDNTDAIAAELAPSSASRRRSWRWP